MDQIPAENDKVNNMQKLIKEVYSGPMLGGMFEDGGIELSEGLEDNIKAVYAGVVQILYPLLEEQGLDNTLRYVMDKSIAFIAATAVELLNQRNMPSAVLDGLVYSTAAIALLQVIDHQMDWGLDPAMPAAISMYSTIAKQEDANTPGSQKFSQKIGRKLTERLELVAGLFVIIEGITNDSSDSKVIKDSTLQALLDEFEIYKLGKNFVNFRMQAGQQGFSLADERQTYLHEHANSIAKLSISNVALNVATYMIYSIYRQVDDSLPDINSLNAQTTPEVISVNPLAKMLKLSEGLIRILDDLGDRRADSGNIEGLEKSFTFNLFNQGINNRGLVRQYLVEMGLTPGQVAEGIELICDEGRVDENGVGDVHEDAVKKFVIDIAQARFKQFKALVDYEDSDGRKPYEKYRIFVRIMCRILEAGFVNALGDHALAGN